MSNRWIRFLLAVLAIAAASAAAYRVVENEQQLAREVATAREARLSADSALAAVEELQSTLHAYVAPGQGADFWTARAQLLLNRARTALLALDAPATRAGMAIADVLDACDRLAAIEQRAAGYARSSQPLLAGEVIFTDARDLFDGMRIEIARTRDQLDSVAARRQVELRRQQMYLTAGGAGVLALVMLLLVPTGRAASMRQSDSPPEHPDTSAVTAAAPAAAAADAPMNIVELASLCHELARVSESRQLQPLLDRARALLGARGVIVWMAANGGDTLQAAAVSGYDDRVVAKIGSISRSDSNLTANAFRENAERTSGRSRTAPAALALPLPAPGGPAGVFSAELIPGAAVDEATLNAARVIAAQLGSVLGSASVRPPDEVGDPSSTAAARSSP